MAEDNDSRDSAESPGFEEALERLEHVVRRLEEGELGLAEALAEYEQGVQMLKQCYALLERAERRIELLTGVDADGNPIVQPFSDRAEALPSASPPSRGKRRSAARKTAAEPSPELGPDRSPEPDNDVDAPGSLF